MSASPSSYVEFRWRHGGFTLVELLVVIGIIALLISILLPSLKRAREHATMVECAANLRQVGQALAIFAQNHDGRYPGRAALNASGPGYEADFSWHDILNVEVYGNTMERHGSAGPIQRFAMASATPGEPGHGEIGRGPGRLMCPNFEWTARGIGVSRSWRMSTNALGGINTPPSYNPRGAGTGVRRGGLYGAMGESTFFAEPEGFMTLGARVSRYRQPAEKMLVMDGMLTGDQIHPSIEATASPFLANEQTPFHGAFAYRHPGLRATALYVDGHVDTFTPSDFIALFDGGWSIAARDQVYRLRFSFNGETQWQD